jgi:hypothetical protein
MTQVVESGSVTRLSVRAALDRRGPEAQPVGDELVR